MTFGSGTYNSCTALTTNGSGVVACTASDRRVKVDGGIVSPSDALAAVLRAPDAHAFSYKDGYGPTGTHYGWFAQDVEKSFPELVSVGPATDLTPDGERRFDKAELSVFAVPAIKALEAQVLALGTRVSDLTAAVANVKAANDDGIKNVSFK